MSINDMIMTEANAFRGTWEWKGAEHNPKVLAMYADAGHPEIRNDEVPWCAAFVGSVLARVGLQNTGSLLAKSYLKWGTKVPTVGDSEPGDIVILHRGTKEWQGHVGFMVGYDERNIHVLGGNQGNQVNVSKYPRAKLAGIRRAKKPKQSVTESTTVGASLVGATSTVAGGLSGISALDGTAQLVVVVATVLALLAFIWIFRERIKKFAAGVR